MWSEGRCGTVIRLRESTEVADLELWGQRNGKKDGVVVVALGKRRHRADGDVIDGVRRARYVRYPAWP